MRKTIHIGLIACTTVLVSCRGASIDNGSRYLEAAIAVSRWMQSTASDARTDGRIPDEIHNPTTSTSDLGVGSAGRSLFFLEMFHATNDSAHLRLGEQELELALTTLRTRPNPSTSFGLYNGIAGVAFAASEFYRATETPRFRTDALALREIIQRGVDVHGPTASWGPVNDIMGGSAGIGLALLSIARSLNDTVSLRLATRAGRALMEHARVVEQGWWWTRSEDSELNLPNFSHGTAGIGFFLARLANATGDRTFLAAAERAAAYLIHVADRSDRLFLVPYGIPNDGYVTAFDIGWAHGPAGTGNLFAELARIAPQPLYEELVDVQGRALMASGIPQVTTDSMRWAGPFRIDRRFGTSGAAVFLLRLAQYGGNPHYNPLARTLIDDILSRGEWEEGKLSWRLPRYGFQQGPGDDGIYTGFFYGTAGLGLALLQMHYSETGQAASINWPDDAFAPALQVP